jgi:hypothetical protein
MGKDDDEEEEKKSDGLESDDGDSVDLSDDEAQGKIPELKPKPRVDLDEEIKEQMNNDLGFLIRKESSRVKKKKSKDEVDNLVNDMMIGFYEESKRVITEAMAYMNSDEYRMEKLAKEKAKAAEEGRRASTFISTAKYEFLEVMD